MVHRSGAVPCTGPRCRRLERHSQHTAGRSQMSPRRVATWCAAVLSGLLLAGCAAATTPAATTPVALPPPSLPTGLHVAGNQLVDGSGAVVRLRGVNASGTEYACI